jgi:hypothetical protein
MSLQQPAPITQLADMSVIMRVSASLAERLATGDIAKSVRMTRHDAEFEHLLRSSPVSGVCWEASRTHPPTPQSLDAVAVACERGAPLLLVADPRLRAVVQFCAERVRRNHALAVAILGADDVEAEIKEWLSRECELGPSGHVLRELVGRLPTPVHDAALVIAAQGKRSIGVGAVADLIGCSTRTMEARFKHCGALPPGQLLGWSLMCHASWWIAIEGITLKQADARARVGEAGIIARLRRTIGPRPMRTLRREGFGALIAKLAEVLR